MLKKLFSLLLVSFLTACASIPNAQNQAVRPKPFVTPWQYYSKARSAVFTDQDSAVVQKAATSQPLGDDTKEDHTQAIIIGTIVGVLAVGGTVAGILIAK